MSSSNINVRSVVANVLKIDDSAAWEIVDSIPTAGLVMVHYKQDADLNKFGELRGVVVDVEAGTVVCRSFGATPTVIADVIAGSPDDHIHLVDTNGIPFAIDVAQMAIKLSFEGTIVRVFKHKGVVYHSTHRRLDISNSRWGASKTFQQMYRELDGPSDESLFDADSAYSPYCHVFLLVHPDVLVATKQRIGPGYIVYLGPRTMWNVEYAACPYKQTGPNGELLVSAEEFAADPRPNAGWIDDSLYAPDTLDYFPEDMDQPFIYAPSDISFDEANLHLAFGFYSPYQEQTHDIRTRPGEAVMIYVKTPEGEKLYKIQSSSYSFRVDMRNNDPNLLHQFYFLTNGSYIPAQTQEGFHQFVSRFPLYAPYSMESVRETILSRGPFVIWPQTSNVQMNPTLVATKDDRLLNIWIAFLMSVPLHRQLEVVEIYNSFTVERGNVISWLYNIANNVDPTMEVPARAHKILEVARDGARKRVETGQTQSFYGKSLDYNAMVHDNIRNLISKEEGTSLYRLMRAMKAAAEPRKEVVKPLTVQDFLTPEQQ